MEKNNVKKNTVVEKILENRKPDKIYVKDLIKKYESLDSDATKAKYLSSVLKIKNYVEFNIKRVIANQIIQQSCFDKNGNIHIDSTYKYYLYIISIFTLYTNIEFEKNDSYDDYDSLNRNQLIEKIINMIPENEIEEYRTIVQVTYDDCLENNNFIKSIIKDTLIQFWPTVSNNVNILLKDLDSKLNTLDLNKVEKFINNISN